METKRKRLTLDLDPTFQRRAKGHRRTQRRQHAKGTAKMPLIGS